MQDKYTTYKKGFILLTERLGNHYVCIDLEKHNLDHIEPHLLFESVLCINAKEKYFHIF